MSDAPQLQVSKNNNSFIKLNDYLESVIGKKFVWGETHCVAIIAGCLDAMYGTDYTTWMKENYVHTAEKCLEYCSNKEVTKQLKNIGYEEGIITQVKSGDVLIVYDNDYECCHIWSGSRFISSRLGGNVVQNSFAYGMELVATRDTLVLCHKP